MNRKMNQLLDGQPPADSRFTEKQGQYLAFIWAYRQLNGQSPAERDMQRYFRVTPPSVHQMVLTLERASLIRRQPGIARGIELLVDPNILPQLRPIQPVKSSVQRY
jgi:Mn-dependent DtxR family transcriptional regulator